MDNITRTGHAGTTGITLKLLHTGKAPFAQMGALACHSTHGIDHIQMKCLVDQQTRTASWVKTLEFHVSTDTYPGWSSAPGDCQLPLPISALPREQYALY